MFYNNILKMFFNITWLEPWEAGFFITESKSFMNSLILCKMIIYKIAAEKSSFAPKSAQN